MPRLYYGRLVITATLIWRTLKLEAPVGQLPIVDIAPWLNDNPEDADKRLAVSAALHRACVDFGFFYLNIDAFVDRAEPEELTRLGKEFFGLPQEEKDKLALKNQDYTRGYARLKENVTNGKADNHEGIDFYKPVEAPDKKRPLWGENQWPTVPGFREKYEIWVAKMKMLGLVVMKAMAVGLGLTEEEQQDLLNKVDDSFWVMRVIGYPPLPDDHDGISCGAHKFLYADPTPSALQVFLQQPGGKDTVDHGLPREQGNEEGVWLNADPIPGCVVCNIGEMWEIWTDGLYKSTLHRVIHRGSNYRASVPFFFEPNYDALVKPLPGALRKKAETTGEEVGKPVRTSVVYGKFLLGKAAIANLSAPTKDLVQKVTANGTELLGETEADQASVNGWIEKAAQGDVVKEGNLKNLNETLTPKTYIATNYLTAADVALYGALHPVVAGLKSQDYYALPSVTRYFDHIQSRPAVRSSADALQQFPTVTFDLEGAPSVERKAEPKKKEKAPKPAAAEGAADAPAADRKGKKPEAASAAAAEGGEKPQQQKKKEKKGQEEGSSKKKEKNKAPAAPAADDGEPVPSMIDLRVGHIVDVIKHPDADGLYVEQIDIGEETGPRTVVSGLVNYIPIEDMRDKYLVAVCNLKPANMRGVKSFAMVLCASSKDGKEGGIELIQPPEGSKPGERVYFEGEEYESATPLSQLNPKKKIFEAIQPGFITLDTKEAAWINPATKSVHKIRTKDGVCVAPTLVGASLS
ncbi:hypothetical protein EST38_g2450 [Candolleomyces aberdarensis]|uniref:Uncharacterized protein n=1 Tax=Candolleomyces aberdarensis TaxID=2316362 RepID=A0A4V1Q4V3_9AGAR|nr:hypothetical protein EST38_g2450 [Candolleomyces aberdarensis]